MATLARFDFPREFARLQSDLNRWFDDRLPTHGGSETYGWTPAVDIFEDTEGVKFTFDLPDVDPKTVDVRLEDGTLTVKGERKLEREDKRDGYHRIERHHGAFARSFSLPATLDFEKVHAETKHGVLRIFVPKRQEAKPRSIQVKIN